MRVIAGCARRLQLKTPKGMDTRPTTDRIRETLFNIISGGLSDAMFLDLFGGSGAVGIEALSRGARMAVFAENSRAAVSCIKDNLIHTRLISRAKIFETDVLKAIRQMESAYKFDYIFMDPPYGKLMEKQVLEALSNSPVLADDGIIIIEAALKTDFSYAAGLGFDIVRIKEYKTNKHVFLKRDHV